jgi:hypothetical protein
MTKQNESHDRHTKHTTFARSIRDRHIAFLDGRPKGRGPIDTDDITNLSIALNTSTSLEEFLCSV